MTTRIVAMNLAKKEAWSHEGKIVAFCDVEMPSVRLRGAALIRLRHDAGWAILPPRLRERHPLAPVVGIDWIGDGIPAATVESAVELYSRLGGDVGAAR